MLTLCLQSGSKENADLQLSFPFLTQSRIQVAPPSDIPPQLIQSRKSPHGTFYLILDAVRLTVSVHQNRWVR